jgi:hypothetical protein
MSGLRFSASATCSDAHEYRFCVAPVEGQVGGLWLDARSNRVLSDRDLLRPLGFYVRYFGNPPATWSLRCHLSAATAFGDSSVLTAWELGEQGTTGVRGYGAASAPGRSRYTAGAQFRRPLWWIERGLGTGPLFLSNLNGAAFLDLGLCATGLGPTAGELQRTRIGIGAELRLDLVAFHLLPARLTAGAGIGLNPAASLQCYLGLQSDMLTGLLTRTDPDAQLRAALSRLAP